MKKIKRIVPLALLAALTFAGCSSIYKDSSGDSDSETVISGSMISADTSDATSVEDVTVDDDDIDDPFVLVDSSGNAVSQVNNVYTLSKADTFTATGKLDGQIKVNAPGEDVDLVLEGVSISNSTVSPIYVVTCQDFKIKAKKETSNYIYDKRTIDYAKAETDDGRGAIFALDGDLNFSGQGLLYVYSYQNSGIHGKDNVKIKNLTLVIKAQNNGIRGNDKITIEEGPTINIYADNNGLYTAKSKIGSGGAQHGYIYINGGTILINSNGDGIDAAYSVEVGTSTDSEGITYIPQIAVYTGKYSSFYNSTVAASAYRYIHGGYGPGGNPPSPGGGTSGTQSADKNDDSAKGIKANNAIGIRAGDIYIQAYDDGLHANTGSLDTGSTGTGAITIDDGLVKIYCSDDGAHADGTLTINGGALKILASHEGLEGKTVNVHGGEVRVSPVYVKDEWGVSIATDDAINASNTLNITGGLVEASVNPSGQNDCLDSNGAINISGGVVIARGPNSGGECAIDASGNITISGGTVVFCGAINSNDGKGTINYTGTNVISGISIHSSGNHSITVSGTTYSFTNAYSYNSTTCRSNVSSVTGS